MANNTDSNKQVFHTGVDIDHKAGKPIPSVPEGKVVKTGSYDREKMQKYMVRLKGNYYEGLKTYYLKQNIHITYVTNLIPDFVIVETNRSLEELRLQPFFKSVEKSPIGTVDV